MKSTHFSYALFALLAMATTACCPPPPTCDQVVCESYVHRYGVPLDPQDWSARGQHGQVVSTRKDGVVMTRSYDSGVLHGETTYTFPHRDTIQKKECYEQGNLTQEVHYYSSGTPYRQMAYPAPDKQTCLTWYETGVPQAREEYCNQRLAKGEYYNINQQLEARVDNHQGQRIRRDGQGQLQSLDTIQNGQMVLQTTYHPNKAPAASTPYQNGMIQGERRTFLPGGEPATIEEWSNNKQHGWTTVFENGERVAEAPYVAGKKQGLERRYREGETVVQETTWENGRKHGPTYSYVGPTTQTDWYFNNRLVNKPTYDVLKNQ